MEKCSKNCFLTEHVWFRPGPGCISVQVITVSCKYVTFNRTAHYCYKIAGAPHVPLPVQIRCDVNLPLILERGFPCLFQKCSGCRIIQRVNRTLRTGKPGKASNLKRLRMVQFTRSRPSTTVLQLRFLISLSQIRTTLYIILALKHA